jgi:hypothetical protein
MERQAFLHRRTATLIYNFASGFGGGETLKEEDFWPLELDKELRELTFEEYMKAKKKQNLPDEYYRGVFQSTFKLETNG